jgi:hypothetical protein
MFIFFCLENPSEHRTPHHAEDDSGLRPLASDEQGRSLRTRARTHRRRRPGTFNGRIH